MKRYKLSDMTGGWFIGAFKPACLVTKNFEVAVKTHKAGEDWPEHYQKTATEYNLLVDGKMRINGQVFKAGDIFVIEPGEAVKPKFYSDCRLVVVKVPSDPKDKVVV